MGGLHPGISGIQRDLLAKPWPLASPAAIGATRTCGRRATSDPGFLEPTRRLRLNQYITIVYLVIRAGASLLVRTCYPRYADRICRFRSSFSSLRPSTRPRFRYRPAEQWFRGTVLSLSSAVRDMRRLCALTLWGFAAAPLRGQSAVPMPLVLTHITVVNITGGPSRPDMSVTISGGRIASITPSSGAVVPRGMKVVNAAGKYLIPGLWDMHVHLTEAPSDVEESGLPAKANARTYYFPLLVANGVLGVRDMAGMLDTLISFRKEIASGKTLGPRLMVTGFKWGRPGRWCRSVGAGRDGGSGPHRGGIASPARRRLCESGFRARKRVSIRFSRRQRSVRA